MKYREKPEKNYYREEKSYSRDRSFDRKSARKDKIRERNFWINQSI